MLTHDQARQLLYQLTLTLTGARLNNRHDALTWLGQLPSADLIRLDNVGRRASGRPDPTEESGLGALLASMHADGHLREKALPHLTGDAGAALLAIRTADRVPEVRSTARALLLNGQYSDRRILGVLLAIRERLHAGDLVDHFASKLAPDQLANLRTSKERALRRWAFQQGRLTTPELEAGALDNDQWLRAWCADALAQRADADIAPRLLGSNHVETRIAAVLRLPDELLSDEAIRHALFDKSVRVRELAQWRYLRRGGCPAQLYRDAEESSDARIYALIATGDPSDLEFVVGQLAHRRPAVRRAAAKAVAAWTDGDERARLLGPLLLDPAPKVVGAVVPALADLPRTTTAGALAAALSSDQPWSRRAVMRLETHRQSWYALEVILQLVDDQDPELAALARATLTDWLSSGDAAGQRLPDNAQKDRLRRLVVGAGLEDPITRQIVFYARL